MPDLEYLEACKLLFAQADVDKDGKISIEDFRNMIGSNQPPEEERKK